MTQRKGLKARGNALRAAALVQVLMRYAGWGGSTSGVERLFARQAAQAPPQRAACDEHVIDDDLALLSSDPKDDAEAIKHARRLWARMYGSVRCVRHPRRDIGIAKGAQSNRRTEISFIRTRRKAVGDMLHTARPVPAACPELEASHIKELAFQKAKLHKRVAQALKNGMVPIAELSDEVVQGVLQHFGPVGGDRGRAPKRQRVAARDKPGKVDVRGKGAFLTR